MTDSLDMLMTNTRQASMGRRAVAPVGVSAASTAASPISSRQGSASRIGQSSQSYGYAESPSASRRDASMYGAAPAASPRSDYPAARASPPLPSPTRPSQFSYPSGVGQGAAAGYQSQPTHSVTSPSPTSSPSPSASSSGGSVDWAAFKRNRVGSAQAGAGAGAAAAAASPTAQQTSAQAAQGQKSGAAGLADQYMASRTNQQQQQQQQAARPAELKPARTDDTVISGAVIAPLKTAAPVQSAAPSLTSPVKRNPFASPPAGSPVAASPYATATSSLSRPAVGPDAPVPAVAAGTSGAPLGADALAGAQRNVQTFSCPDCGRSFKRGSLMKHAKVCKKVFSSKRAQFDSSKVRTQDLGPYAAADGEDDDECEEDDEQPQRPRTAAAPKTAGAKREESKEEQDSAAAKSKWKDQSAGLREAMRRAKAEKACFAQSNAMGIDMGRMMMNR